MGTCRPFPSGAPLGLLIRSRRQRSARHYVDDFDEEELRTGELISSSTTPADRQGDADHVGGPASFEVRGVGKCEAEP